MKPHQDWRVLHGVPDFLFDILPTSHKSDVAEEGTK